MYKVISQCPVCGGQLKVIKLKCDKCDTVIENDFHDRPDLTPNVCAVYVEKAWRCQGIAGALLRAVCEDMRQFEIKTLYLLTDHTNFYERYGWEFLCLVQGDGETEPARMYGRSTNSI